MLTPSHEIVCTLQLMRTILYSSERVTAGSADAAVFICFLLIFAVSAAYYVLKNGLAVSSGGRVLAAPPLVKELALQHWICLATSSNAV